MGTSRQLHSGALLAAAMICCLFCRDAKAAEISADTITSDAGEQIPVIFVSGELLAADILKFEEHANRTDGRAVVVFSSPGGNVDAGIEMGKLIHRRGFATGVFDTCASACSLAWLAGRIKYTTPESRIGFHVVYVGSDVRQESGMGNALVGLYLGGLGLGPNVVKYVTSAPPDGMQWLSFRDAELLGISITLLPGSEEAAAPPVSRQAPAPDLPDMTGIVGFDPENSARAVKNSLARYREAGMAGLEASSGACWRSVAEKLALEKVQYCRVLDMVGRLLSDSAGYGPASAYFSSEHRVNSVVDGMRMSGITDPAFAARTVEIWQAQMDSALAAAVQQ